MKFEPILAVQGLLRQTRQLIQTHTQTVTGVLALAMLGTAGATFAVASLAPQDEEAVSVHSVIEAVQSLPIAAGAQTFDAQALRLYRTELTRSSDTVDTLLRRLGLFDPTAAAFIRADRDSHRALMGRSGRIVTAEASTSNELLRLTARWSPEDNGTFQKFTIENTPAGFVSRIQTLPLLTSTRLAGGIIHSSLFAATDDASIPDAIAVQVAEIFSGDIDFNRALRKGDRFSIVYETLEGDGEPLRTGRVLSAEFINDGKVHQAMWFQDPTTQKGGYYTLDGESLRRAFLASPLEFSRVTSGFKMRFHPILKTWRAHLGLDYGAPTGTRVRSVGDGVVEFAGRKGGFGNVVILKHASNQSTVYAHLSRIHVRRGQRVAQGQTIGAVGATGWATGPHLHFEFRVNGAHKDPRQIARQAQSVPVAAAARPQFAKEAAQMRQQLAAASVLRPATAQ